MKKLSEEMIVEELSKRFNKKDEIIRTMLNILKQNNYCNSISRKMIIEFYSTTTGR